MALGACSKYIELSGENLHLFHVFSGWMAIKRPGMYNFRDEERCGIKTSVAEFLPTGKLAYFKDLPPVAMREGA